MTVAQALDDLDGRIAAVEEALDAGEVPDLPDFSPQPVDGIPTPAERERFGASMLRLQACQERLRDHRARLLRETAELGRRRRAVTAYGNAG